MREFQLIKRVIPDLENEYRKNVADIWSISFGEKEVSETRGQLAGEESPWNRDILYLAVADGQVAACCHITRLKGTPWAGLGGVVSSPAFRGCGAGKTVCNFALTDFDAEGGEAIWLGTSNPVAANLYSELGFSFVSGTHIMLRITGKKHPTQLYDELFPPGECIAARGTPAARIPVIPLCTQIVHGLLKEANAQICNPNIVTQTSCMGLFPRLQKISESGGEWCMLNTPGITGGIASYLPLPDGRIRADAFCHDHYTKYLSCLMQNILEKAEAADKPVFVSCSEADTEKKEVLLSLGFCKREMDTVVLQNGLQLPVWNYCR